MAGLPILVLGATGGQGGAVADALLARGARVRAMVRRPGEPKASRLAERVVEEIRGSGDGVGQTAGRQLVFDDGLTVKMRYTGVLIRARDRAKYQVWNLRVGGGCHDGAPLGYLGILPSLKWSCQREHCVDTAHGRAQCGSVVKRAGKNFDAALG